MGAIYQLIIQLVIYYIIALINSNKKPPASKLEDLSVPEVSESKSIAIGFGTYKQKSPNLVQMGNLSTKKLTEGGGFLQPSVTIGYKYYLSHTFMLSHGPVDLLKIYIDDKEVYNNDSLKTGSFTGSYSNGNFFSDDNGVSAIFDFYTGDSTQTQNDHLNNDLELTFPTYKYISYIVLRGEEYVKTSGLFNDIPSFETASRGAYIGNSLVLKPMSFLCKRIPKYSEIDNSRPLGVSWAEIDGDCNPAFIIYDMLVGLEYGLEIDSRLIDINSFKTAAEVLYNEGFGLSLIYEDKFSCRDFVNEIARHVGGNVIEDSQTGKIKFKLSRADYVVDDLFLFDESNITEYTNFERSSRSDLFNEIQIEFTNRESNYKTTLARYQNLGLRFDDRAASAQSQTSSFPFITKPELANKVAERESKPLSNNLSTIQIKTHRKYDLEVGDVFNYKKSDDGINQITYRIQKINYGTLTNNTMTINAIEDYFALSSSIYEIPPSSKYESLNFDAVNMDLQFIESPRFVSNNTNTLLFYSWLPNDTTKNFSPYIDEGNGYISSGTTLFNDILQINADVDYLDTSIEINNVTNFEILSKNDTELDNGENLCLLINNSQFEFIAFKNASLAGSVLTLNNVRRGCLDSLPKVWAANTGIFLLSNSIKSANVDLLSNENINIKGITRTDKDVLALADASTINYTMNNEERYLKPIICSNVKANNIAVLTQNTINIGLGNELALTWNFRNVENQTKVKHYTLNDETTNTSGTNYNIKIYDDTETLIKEVDTTSNSYNFDDELTINPGAVYYDSLRVEIISELNGYTSLESFNITVTRS